MKYILCEDSGSGFQFFRRVRDICSSKEECKVLTSNGNSQYLNCLEKLILELETGDILILAFDSVEVEVGFNPRNIINTAKYFCHQKNVSLYYTIYYCFEEVFLSYQYLEEMFELGTYSKDDKDIWLSILHYIYESIHSGNEYYIGNHDLVEYVKSIIQKAGRTKEKFTKAVLTHISGSILGDFKIYDGAFGNCWIVPCNDIKMKNKSYRCIMCNSRFKNMCKIEKLLELEENALPILTPSLSGIFLNQN